MDNSILLDSSVIFDDPNLIDCIRQLSIDFESDQDSESIQGFLNKSKKYLDEELSNDTLAELISTILSCFRHFLDTSLPFINEFLQKTKLNDNYIILTAMLLSSLVYEHPGLALPDYHPFVLSALDEILPQLQNESKLIIFDHEIPIQFKNDLILSLLLCTDLSEKLIYDFFPYLFSSNFSKQNQKFKILIQKVTDSNFNKILPQTKESNDELYEFITNKDFKLISTMHKEAFSLIQNSILFTKSGGKSDTSCLTKETILPFTAIVLLFFEKFKIEPALSEPKLTSLFFEGIQFLQSNGSPTITASIDLILKNYLKLFTTKFISDENAVKILDILAQQLFKGQYLAQKTVLVFTIFDSLNQPMFNVISSQITDFINKNGFDIIKYVIQNSSEFTKSEDFRLNLTLFDPILINSFIQSSDDICQTISFINNFCYCDKKPVVSYTKDMSTFLKAQIQAKINEGKIDDALTIIKFMDILLFLNEPKEIEEMKLPEQITQHLSFSTQKQGDSIDNILTHILSMNYPEKNDEPLRILFNKMMEDDELLEMNLCFLTFKYYMSFYEIPDFLRYYLKEYEKHGDKFIKAVNKVYNFAAYQDKTGKSLVRRFEFSIYSLPISNLGSSIVTKLFNSIDEKKNNYQAFFCLKSIASSFPLLFYNRQQEIFDHVFPLLNDFVFIFDQDLNMEMNLKLKTAYSAFSFLLSTFQLPILIDHFINAITEDITKYTNAQIACFINALSIVCTDSILKLIIYGLYKKKDFMKWIGKAQERKVEKDTFGVWYKRSIYEFISNYYYQLYGLDAKVKIQADETSKFENPIGDYYDQIFAGYLLEYLPINLTVDRCNLLCKDYMSDVEKVRPFWLIFDHRKVNNSVTTEKVDEFIGKLGVDFNNLFSYVYPKETHFCSIKMMRYLVRQPVSIYSYYLFHTKIPLYESMLTKLFAVDEELDKLLREKDENYEDEENANIKDFDTFTFLLPYYCQSTVLNNLVREVNELTRDEQSFFYSYGLSIMKCIKELSNYGIALLSMLEFMSQNMIELHSNDLLFESPDSSLIICNIISYLKTICFKTNFINNFMDMCGDTLIDLVLSPQWRRDPAILSNVASLFMSFENRLPVRITHFVSFCLMSDNGRANSIGLQFCSQLTKDQLSLVEDTILSYFDRNYASFNLEMIEMFIRIIPSIIDLRRPIFAEIINIRIEAYSKMADKNKNDLLIIGEFLNKLAPDRNNSMSVSHVINESSLIPDKIMEMAPQFWSMFAKNGKIIFDEIDNDPMLLDHFRFLLQYPELLSFKTRSSYFSRKMVNSINVYDNLNIQVDRSNLLETSMNKILGKTRNQLMKDFIVKYKGESGEDERGITRDWFTSVTKELFSANLGLFDCSLNKMSYKPSSKSISIPNYLNLFKFAGILIARALIQGICIDVHLTTFVLKQILHRQPNLNDIQDYDVSVYHSLKTIEECTDIDSLELVFAVDRPEADGSGVKTIPLKPNGENILVTNDNKNEFIQLRINYICKGEIEEQMKALCNGFDSLISHREIKIFTPEELNLLISGIPEIDVEDFKKNVEYGMPYDETNPVIVMFFNVISKWNAEQKAKLLIFMTGSSRVPVNGFKEFCQICGKPLLIAPGGERSLLPQAHTCNNMLCLPEYQNEDEMNEKLLYAIYNADGFEII